MSKKELSIAIEKATKRVAEMLFTETDENFYYFSLITSGEAHAPYITAWSKEQLEKLPQEQHAYVKWSHVDSPYCGYGSEYFIEVERLFANRPDILNLSDVDRINEYNLRIDAMESAIAKLCSQGVFGIGKKREQIVVNVEVMPPDHTNTERAIRLNSKEALVDWLEEAAE